MVFPLVSLLKATKRGTLKREQTHRGLNFNLGPFEHWERHAAVGESNASAANPAMALRANGLYVGVSQNEESLFRFLWETKRGP